ncbi:MmgE/PrpD family protein [Dactylosporangium fulvum]|uniref:MmgE/PrpD family protein n=1 Tax=Dactylosporangium fulvum TaxID=53359 RepID=A0ABY5VTQ0_9ACTN|nr:MmgE/PrpD family protein [Dactylosporangium fulvum]UWP80206.1 MmgE/PrpD family protein [Dactylosporangium fulvum]
MNSTPPTVAAHLADWAVRLTLQDVPASAQDAACRHLLDGLAVALGALGTGAAAPALTVAGGLGGPAEATLLGTGRRLGAPAAAFATGALVHALDFDDTHAEGLVHATAVTLPAALAVGEQVGATGAQVLTAALVGYEVTCRVAAATPYGFHQRGIHATQAAGVVGATTVAARLMGLDAATTLHAMGIAGSSAGGLMEFLHTGSSTKQLHPGLASHAGILAARLAAAGATGPDSVLDGAAGLWAALSDRSADPARVLRELGQTWEVTRVTIKPYPACQLSHATLDAAATVLDELRAAGGTAEIAEVVAFVHPDSAAIVCEPAADKVHPQTPYGAKFSLPWSVAALLVDGSVSIGTYDVASVGRPAVAELAARVRTVLAPSRAVAADAAGRVVVRLRNGRELTGEVASSRGGPDAPLDDQAMLAKLLSLTGDSPAARQMAATVHALADLPDLTALLDVIARAARTPIGTPPGPGE